MIENYFDYAAATPVAEDVLKAVRPYWNANFYNPSAGYILSKNVSKDLEKARSAIANVIGSKSSEIIFVAGGTEANNLAVNGIMQKFPDNELVVGSIEHDSVLVPSKKYKSIEIPVNPKGYVELERLKKLITEKTVLVSVMLANNEIGTIQPIRKISKIIAEVLSDRKKIGNKLPLIFHTDASQAGNYLRLNVDKLGVDMMTVNGGKIYGPKQTAFLYVNSKVRIDPQIVGGGQENGKRSGTENVAGFIGLSKAFTSAQEVCHEEAKRLSELQQLFIGLIHKNSDIKVNGGDLKLPNNIHLTIKGQDNETLMMKLDEAGYQIAVGSACSASSDDPSHVLMAIGLTETEAQSSIRITLGRYSTKKSVTNLANALLNIV